MTGPYERVRQTTDLRLLSGRIELQQGPQAIVAAVFGGEATIELIEHTDTVITQFGSDQPIRTLGARNRIRLTVEADLDQLTFTTEPGNG